MDVGSEQSIQGVSVVAVIGKGLPLRPNDASGHRQSGGSEKEALEKATPDRADEIAGG